MHVFDVKIGKHKLELVSGLTWHPLVPDNLKKDLLPLAEDMEADLYVYRRSDKSMVGFAKTSDGAKLGQIPLALVVAQAMEREGDIQNALVALAIPGELDTYAYVLIREGFVLSDKEGAGTEEDIKTEFFSNLSVAGWDLLICPEHWKVARSAERSLESFFPENGKKFKIPQFWQLRPTKTPWVKNLTKVLAVALVVGGAYAGFKQWQKVEAQKQAAILAAQAAAAEEAARQAKLSAEPWPTLPRATVFASACESALNAVGIPAANWALNEFTCEGTNLTVKWERSSGRAWISHMKNVHPSAVISPDGAFATVTTALQLPKLEGKTGEQAPAMQARIEALRDMPNAYGMNITLTMPTAQAAPPNPGGAAPLVLPWTEIGVKVDSPFAAGTSARALDGPAFRITKITGTSRSGLLKYQLLGVQYAKN